MQQSSLPWFKCPFSMFLKYDTRKEKKKKKHRRNDNKIIYYPSSKQNGMIFMKKVKND